MQMTCQSRNATLTLQITNLGFKTAQIGATPATELHESVQDKGSPNFKSEVFPNVLSDTAWNPLHREQSI